MKREHISRLVIGGILLAIVIGVLIWLNVSDDETEVAAAPTGPQAGVNVIDVAGGTGTFLTPGSEPVWSPDGTQLAITSEEEGETGVYLVDVGGDIGGKFLTPGSGPVWSPDGTQLAFTSEEEGDVGVYVIEIPGGSGTFLTPGSGPVWSPDGSQLAFSAEEGDETGIYLIDASGERRRVPHPRVGAGVVSRWDSARLHLRRGRRVGCLCDRC